MVFLQPKKSNDMAASSPNIATQIHHISDEPPNHALNCAPRLKLTARKSTHFLRRRVPPLPGNLTKEQPTNGNHLPNYNLKDVISPLTLPSDGLSFESLEEVLGNIPPDISDPPKLSAFDDIGENLNHRLNPIIRSENAIPRLIPVVTKRTARKSFPPVYARPRESTNSADYLLKSLQNCLIANKCLNDARFRLSNKNCNGTDAWFEHRTRFIFPSDPAAERRLPKAPEIRCLGDSLLSVPKNLADLRSIPLVIIDGSIRKVQRNKSFADGSIRIVLTNDYSVIYTGPDRFILAVNCTAANAFREKGEITPTRILRGTPTVINRTSTLSPNVFAYPPPPVLSSELPPVVGEEYNGNVEMPPPLLLPTFASKELFEQEERESSKSPEMPVLSPIDGENLELEPEDQLIGLQPESVNKVLPEGEAFGFRARYKTQRRRGLALSFKRQCPVRTARTEAYFQGRYAFMAGKKVRDPNWKKNMNGSKSLENGSPRPRLMKMMRPRRWRRGGRRPRLRRNVLVGNSMQHNPHVDVIDGLEFLSFETEQDLLKFMKCHPSVTLDVSKLSDKELEKFSLLPETKEPALGAVYSVNLPSGQRIRGEPIVLTKTNDFTKIKGWRHKVFMGTSDKSGKGENVEKRVSLSRMCKTMAEIKICSAAHNFGNFGPMPVKEKASSVQSHEGAAPDVSPPKERAQEEEKVSSVITEKTGDPTSIKSAFVSDFLDEFLRTNSELKISAAATLASDAALKDSSEIDTKVVWPSSDNYQVPPASPPLHHKYPFCLAPRGRKPKFRRSLPVAKVPAQPAQSTMRPKLIKNIPATVTMETPAYLRCGADASGSPLRLEPVLMSLSDAQFACMALVSSSLMCNTADSLPPLEEIGRMCRRTKDSPETLRLREKMCQEFSVVIDREFAERALRTLRTAYDRELGGRRKPSPDVSAKSFHELSAEEKWERMMNSTAGDPNSEVKEEEPVQSGGNACTEPHCKLGCVCSSLKSSRKKRKHCGRAQCMISCNCSVTDEQQARPEDTEEKPTEAEVPTKRRREIRLPARLKDSVCDWSRAWSKACEKDEEFSLVPRKRRGRYKKLAKPTGNATVIWHDPRKDVATRMKNARLALKRPSTKSLNIAVEPPDKVKCIEDGFIPRIVHEKRAIQSARKSMVAANARKGGQLQGPMLSERPETAPAAIRFPLPSLEKRENIDVCLMPTASPMSVMPNPPDKKPFGNQHPKVHPLRRLLYNPDGSVAGVLVPAESKQSAPVVTRTARKSVSTPLPWASNQRKVLDQLNLAKVALQAKKSSVEDIVHDVVRDLVRRVSLAEELENAMLRFGSSSDSWTSLNKPAPTPQEIVHSPSDSQDDTDREDGKHATRAIERRKCIREGMQRLCSLLVPLGRDPNPNNPTKIANHNVLSMTRATIRHLQKDERALLRTKRRLNKERTRLFERYTQLLKGSSMDAKKQKETIHKLADEIQGCCKDRSDRIEISVVSSMESLNFFTSSNSQSYSKGKEAGKSCNKKLDEDWLNVGNMSPNLSTTGSSGSDSDAETTPRSRAESKHPFLQTTGDQLTKLRKWLSTESSQESRQQNKNLVNGISKTIAAGQPQSVSLSPTKPLMTTVRLKPSGSAPSWIPLHESTTAQSSAKPPNVKSSTKIFPVGAVQTTLVSNKPTHSAPAYSWPNLPFERPRFQASILQRAKVVTKDVTPTSSAPSLSSAAAAIASSNSRWLTKILPKPSLKPSSSAPSGSLGTSAPSGSLGSCAPSGHPSGGTGSLNSGTSNVVIIDKPIVVASGGIAPAATRGPPGTMPGSSTPGGTLAKITKMMIPRLQRPSPLASINTNPVKTYATSTNVMGPNGKPIPFFRSVSAASFPTGPSGSLSPLTRTMVPKGTTLFIGVIPTTTSCTQVPTHTITSLTNSVSKFPGASDKMTPIMAISLPSSATSITLDGKKLCLLKPGRPPANVVTSVTTEEPPVEDSAAAVRTGSAPNTDGAVNSVTNAAIIAENCDSKATSVANSVTGMATSGSSVLEASSATVANDGSTCIAMTAPGGSSSVAETAPGGSTFVAETAPGGITDIAETTPSGSTCLATTAPSESTSMAETASSGNTFVATTAPSGSTSMAEAAPSGSTFVAETAHSGSICAAETVSGGSTCASEMAPGGSTCVTETAPCGSTLVAVTSLTSEDAANCIIPTLETSADSTAPHSAAPTATTVPPDAILDEVTTASQEATAAILNEEKAEVMNGILESPRLMEALSNPSKEDGKVVGNLSKGLGDDNFQINTDSNGGLGLNITVPEETSTLPFLDNQLLMPVIESIQSLAADLDDAISNDDPVGCAREVTTAPAECAVAVPSEDDWPKIVAFTSISEDEFLCEEVEVGRQDAPPEEEIQAPLL